MTVAAYPYLLPLADALTQPFWDAAKQHRLAIQHCSDCGKLRHPPTRNCAACDSEAIGWRALSGRGTLYSFTIVHQTALPNWRAAGPFNIALVALEEAPEIRLVGNVVDCDDSRLRVGLPLVALFDDVTPEDTLVRWRVVDRAAEDGAGAQNTLRGPHV